MKKPYWFLLIVLFLATQCNVAKNDVDIYNEIFPQIIDSLKILESDYYLLLPPAPPSPIFDNEGNLVGYDTIEYRKKIENNEKEKNDIILKYPKLLIGIYDSLIFIELEY